ncbi:bifunctional riboflavin kinase/FAD synthetase [Acetobacteraceae bacterium]|nr:bifunctional riboflavin kinase/FAD synthetase [Acetobacteraceae bacterium]
MGTRFPALHQDWRHIPATAKNCAVALGNFDGVHLGHQYLLTKLARACPSAPLAVVTFAPHPKGVFRPQDPPFQLMNTGKERAKYFAPLGVENIFEIAFTPEFANLSPEQFVEEVLIKSLGVKHVGCGTDFCFGHRRLGNVDLLGKLLGAHGIGLTDIEALHDSEGPISSTRVRRALQEGYPEKAMSYLGRPWSLSGKVLHGDKRGRLLGFPTANVALGHYIEPARGAYICAIKLPDDGGDGAGKTYHGVANIGRRPTINDKVQSRIEAHLFDFSGDLYGREIQIFLLNHLRNEQRFESLNALTTQINADAQAAKEWFQLGKMTEISLL